VWLSSANSSHSHGAATMRLLLTALLLAHSATAHDDGEKRVPWAGSETDLCWTPPHYYAPCVTDRHARRGVMLASLPRTRHRRCCFQYNWQPAGISPRFRTEYRVI
jgi:hypothetical protein